MDSQIRSGILNEPAKPRLSRLKVTRILTALVGWIPLSIGTRIRSLLYRAIFRHLGESVNIRANVSFADANCVEVGNQVRINQGSRLAAKDGSQIILDQKVFLDRDVRIDCGNSQGQIKIKEEASIDRGVDMKVHAQGKTTIGKRTYIGPYTCLSGYGNITIGDDCLIASHSSLYAHNYKFKDADTLIREQGYTHKGIWIGDNCWLGSGVRVLDGVTIGAGSIIGAGSVVTKDIPPNSIAVGTPAKVTGPRSE